MPRLRTAANTDQGRGRISPRPDLFVGSPRRVLAVLGLTILLVFVAVYQASAAEPAKRHFQVTLERTDQPVKDGMADAGETVYILDGSNFRVQRIDLSGSYRAQFGTASSGDGQIISPYRVEVDHAGVVYVLDVGNFRVQKFVPM